MELTSEISLAGVEASEKEEFLALAEAYFKEMNPSFVPASDWRAEYYHRIESDVRLRLRWILFSGKRAGFVIFGTETHRFLPRTNGCIYEFYVLPDFRRTGVGRQAAELVIGQLHQEDPAKIQLEVATGNAAAAEFWRSFGFRSVSERYVLDKERT